MQTREELLQGLTRALALMQSVINLEAERNQIRTQYANQIATQPYTSKKKTFCIAIGIAILLGIIKVGDLIMILFFWTGRSIAQLIAAALLLVLGWLIAQPVRKFMDKSVDKRNEEVNALNTRTQIQNQALYERETQVIQQIQETRIWYEQEVLSWYPNDYCYVDAAEFFLHAVQNYRADTLKEAINLYEDTMHKGRIEQAQQEALRQQQESIRQQKLSNILAVGNLVMQAGIQASISNNTDAINRHTDAVNRLRW